MPSIEELKAQRAQEQEEFMKEVDLLPMPELTSE
jgi:hypothetical protein